MSSEIGWEELEEKVGKIEPGQILELNLLRKVYQTGFHGLELSQTRVLRTWTDSLRSLTNLDQ